jgi:hypothetical protein
MWYSIIFIFLLGSLLHFLYEISGHNKIVALFAAVNESTWEHIKLALTATLIWSLHDGVMFGSNPNYFTAKLLSLLIIIVFIICVFYTYTSITKKPVLFVDILTFFGAIYLAQKVFYLIIELKPLGFIYQYLSVVFLFILFGSYMVLTLSPLKNIIFQDPITKKYGIIRNKSGK